MTREQEIAEVRLKNIAKNILINKIYTNAHQLRNVERKENDRFY